MLPTPALPTSKGPCAQLYCEGNWTLGDVFFILPRLYLQSWFAVDMMIIFVDTVVLTLKLLGRPLQGFWFRGFGFWGIVSGKRPQLTSQIFRGLPC